MRQWNGLSRAVAIVIPTTSFSVPKNKNKQRVNKQTEESNTARGRAELLIRDLRMARKLASSPSSSDLALRRGASGYLETLVLASTPKQPIQIHGRSICDIHKTLTTLRSPSPLLGFGSLSAENSGEHRTGHPIRSPVTGFELPSQRNTILGIDTKLSPFGFESSPQPLVRSLNMLFPVTPPEKISSGCTHGRSSSYTEATTPMECSYRAFTYSLPLKAGQSVAAAPGYRIRVRRTTISRSWPLIAGLKGMFCMRCRTAETVSEEDV